MSRLTQVDPLDPAGTAREYRLAARRADTAATAHAHRAAAWYEDAAQARRNAERGDAFTHRAPAWWEARAAFMIRSGDWELRSSFRATESARWNRDIARRYAASARGA
jgi:hypothetical protein